ncbi:FAD-dependent monooxygenase [Thalassotalea sp. PS06]|uniref:FAD-dependent monooxygenase n=1 Tax=Thalassotalea sp. PS06 TaxID=2594005 RepID=UPI00116400D3|nr:FAD-dependent monooxygenase [Thalassotalea sp. PS06]QDP01893.1 2-octaprenyl-3-methyl-6-methoxy-1,4-benzoquinol hydroxylase [Thalassotalea sp. PS06]
MEKFDCLVIGGGMVGATTAVALADLGLKIALVDTHRPDSNLLDNPGDYDQQQDYNLRVSAVSLGSEQLLRSLRIWQQVQLWRVTPYRRLAVWEQGLSYAEFHCDQIKQSHLGHMVENHLIQAAAWLQIKARSNIKVFAPQKLSKIENREDGITATLGDITIESEILVGADGGNSMVRNLAKIGTSGWDYQHSAMLINVKTEQDQQDITWQHFVNGAPVAFLPLSGNRASLVWYDKPQTINELVNLSSSQLQQRIIEHFPKRLGNIEVIDKGAFPLIRRHANQYVKNRVVLVGDAAHSINPLAGQGVNMGFKDVHALQEVIAKAIGSGEHYADASVLRRYEKQRRNDNLLMMTTMDLIYRGFKQPAGPIKLLRNLGLFGAQRMGPIKDKVLAYACGL